AEAEAEAEAEAPPSMEFPAPEEGPQAALTDVESAAPLAEHGGDVVAVGAPSAWAEAFSTEEPSAPAEPRVGELGQAEFKPFVPLAPEGAQPAPATALDSDEDVDATDVVDVDLFPFFEEEAQELLPALTAQLRDWVAAPQQPAHASAAMRTLHTLKGGARLAGAMRLGELAHRLETAIEHLLQREAAEVADIEALLGRADAIAAGFERLRQRDVQAYAAAQAAVEPLHDTADSPVVTTAWPPLDEPSALQDLPAPMPAPASALDEPSPVVEPDLAGAATGVAEALGAGEDGIDWSRFVPAGAGHTAEARLAGRQPAATTAAVRVRPQLLDRLVNQAGEVSIARARLESGVAQMRGSVGDLTENLERLRQQLRDIELQAETQMSTRMEAAKAAAQSFDPLEFDRFTRFQELTRMMAESVNDVATVQRTLQRTLEAAEDELAAQARLTRELQDDLLRTRMVEFEGLSERLYRVVRQAAKETGKQVRLDIVGGSLEVDRGVLDRMTGAFEHLLRNCVTHGIEAPEARAAAGKDAAGHIVVALRQEGNEVSVEFRDDGAGLDLPRIRDKGVAMGLIDAATPHADAELANLIFMPGFSTAANVTELAGRGVGMDVVRSDVNALGGRIETASAPGQGTSFKLVLPLTTAVTQVVMLRCGQASVAVPATLIEIVRRATPAEIGTGYHHGLYHYGEQTLPFFWLGALLQQSARGEPSSARTQPVVVIRSAAQRIALHVDEVLGNQEVVVKNLGPQLSRLPGLAGMTLLASGAVALIYNPVALATVYAEAARAAMAEPAAVALAQPLEPAAPAVPLAPLVLVVDDSLTVRRVTQRLLAREGYRVVLAKDGLDALEKLADELPAVVLSDIEMPRMDGFDLVRNLRGDARLAALPVIMITSRIAQKHRDYAAELGVNHYLGKPYNEDELLGLIGRYCAQAAPA
ncbi:MAG TPA: hybrid sensor histidine kinase/response regulator, partial [Methylibium sp.]|nr:hybrid sensor histidine kinase/response regulator [Methylibium sp.]